MFTQLKSLGLFGLNAFSVDVEVSMNRGKPQMEIVGLPDTSVRESRERIRSALSSLSIALPARLITVNLAPADVKKIGTMHDLAILLGILVCMERIPAQPASRCFIGEVSLSGLVRSVSGVLPMALLAAQNGVTELYVPAENASEASARMEAANASVLPCVIISPMSLMPPSRKTVWKHCPVQVRCHFRSMRESVKPSTPPLIRENRLSPPSAIYFTYPVPRLSFVKQWSQSVILSPRNKICCAFIIFPAFRCV